MAFNIDPNIPLQAKTVFDPAAIIMQAQQNAAALERHRLEMQKLREDYDAAKEARKRQKAMQMGIDSDLAGIQNGTPAQYSPMTYQQTPRQGQMPFGMTGVLASERGQNMPQPQVFGEDLFNGNYQVGGGEVTQPAVAGRQPTYADMLDIGLKQAMLNKDQDSLFKYAKAIQDAKKDPAKYYGGLTEAIDPVTKQPILLAMTETGAVPSGYAPKAKEGKAIPVTRNGQPVTIKVPHTNEVKILMSDGTYSSGGSIPTPKADKNSDHPVYFNTNTTGEEFLKTLSKSDQAHVKAISEGREQFPTAKVIASNPYYERLADAVAQYNPDFDATSYTTRKKAAVDFTTGVQGKQLLAFGSAVKHLETLGGLVDAMASGDIVQMNRLSNIWQKQTGGVPVNNFEAAKGIVAKEIMKAIVTGGGGVEERQELSHLMDSAKSPEQLKGVIDTYHELMNAQKENLLIQRDAAGLPRSTLPDYTKQSSDDQKTPSSKYDDYKEYKIERGKAYKSGDYELVRKMDAMAKQDGLIK